MEKLPKYFLRCQKYHFQSRLKMNRKYIKLNANGLNTLWDEALPRQALAKVDNKINFYFCNFSNKEWS